MIKIVNEFTIINNNIVAAKYKIIPDESSTEFEKAFADYMIEYTRMRNNPVVPEIKDEDTKIIFN